MKRAHRALVFAGLAAMACNPRPADDPVWRAALERDRAAKDAVFHTSRGPLTPAQRASFPGLLYFAPDRRWNVRTTFEPAAVPDTVRFVTSSGSFDVYLRAGRARFQHRGRDLVLTVYRNLEAGVYFVPFTDATSGESTYGAGRYLDLEPDVRPVLAVEDLFQFALVQLRVGVGPERHATGAGLRPA